MTSDSMRDFLGGQPFAVVGASKDRDKYGNKVLRTYQQQDLPIYVVHPREQEIEGLTCYRDLRSLPETPHGLSIITPPPVTEAVVTEALELGIRHFWIQPGAESPSAVEEARAAGALVIAGGPCLLVALGFRE